MGFKAAELTSDMETVDCDEDIDDEDDLDDGMDCFDE